MAKSDRQDTFSANVAWKFLERFLARTISFSVSVVLARVLAPQDFGIVALVMVFINIATVLATGGFSTALIREKDANSRDFSTAFYCSFALGISVYIMLFIFAPVIENYYGYKGLKEIVRVLGVQIIMGSYSSVQHAYVEQKMIFRKYFFSTLLGTLISGIVGVVMALEGMGIWSIVVQCLLNNLIDIIILRMNIGWHLTMEFSVKSFRKIFDFGWKVYLADLSGTFFAQLRALIVGKFYTPSDLAYYDKGQQFPALITDNISNSVMSVAFPALAKVSDDMSDVKKKVRIISRILSYIVFPMIFGIIGISENLIIVLLSDKWIEAVPFVRILSMASVVSLMGNLGLEVMKAIGKSDVLLKLEIYKKPIYILLLLTGVCGGVYWVAITMLVYAVYSTLINMYQLKKYIGYLWREQLEDIIGTLLLAMLAGGVPFVIGVWAKGDILWLLLQVFAGMLSYLAASAATKCEAFCYICERLRTHKIRS